MIKRKERKFVKNVVLIIEIHVYLVKKIVTFYEQISCCLRIRFFLYVDIRRREFSLSRLEKILLALKKTERKNIELISKQRYIYLYGNTYVYLYIYPSDCITLFSPQNCAPLSFAWSDESSLWLPSNCIDDGPKMMKIFRMNFSKIKRIEKKSENEMNMLNSNRFTRISMNFLSWEFDFFADERNNTFWQKNRTVENC